MFNGKTIGKTVHSPIHHDRLIYVKYIYLWRIGEWPALTQIVMFNSTSWKSLYYVINLKSIDAIDVYYMFLPLSPSGWRGIVVTVRAGGWAGGRAGGCQTCGTHISVTTWQIFSIRSSVELSGPVVVHCHGHLPICPIWACPWAKNLSNLPQIGPRLRNAYLWNCKMDLPHLKFYGLV